MTNIAEVNYNDKSYKVYCYTNKINNKKYIGQTKNSLTQRAGTQGQKYKRDTLFYRAIKKYGWDNFYPQILKDNLTIQEAAYWENYYILKYKTFIDLPDCNGYNLTLGDCSFQRSQETKQRCSQTQKQRFQNQPVSLETKEKQSIAHREYFSTQIARERCKNNMKKRWQNIEYRQYWTEKMSGGNNTQAKKVICLEEPTLIFATVTEASIWCNGNPSLRSHIKQQAEGKRKSCGKHPQTQQPLHWRYISCESRE